MRKHFCGHTSNTSDFKTSSFQEVSVWSWYFHSCSVTSLKMISDCGFGFFIWSLRIALYKYKAFHVLNVHIPEQQEVSCISSNVFLCLQSREKEWMAWIAADCLPTQTPTNTESESGVWWPHINTHSGYVWMSFPVLSSHDTLSAHASNKAKLNQC